MKPLIVLLFTTSLFGQAVTAVPPLFVTPSANGAITLSEQLPSPFAFQLENKSMPPGSAWMTSITTPTVPTLAAGASGVLNGTYNYATRCTLPYGGHTDWSPLASLTVTNTHITVTLPACPGPGLVLLGAAGITLARTPAGVTGNASNLRTIVTVPSSQTSYDDNTADSALGAAVDNDANTAGACLLNNMVAVFCSWQDSSGNNYTAVGAGSAPLGPGIWNGNVFSGDKTIAGNLWSVLPSPLAPAASTSTSGGNYAASTVNWYVVCAEGVTAGESCGTSVSNTAGTGSTNSFTVTYTASVGSVATTSYRVYKGSSDGAWTHFQTINNNAVSIIDTGSNFTSTGSPVRTLPANKFGEAAGVATLGELLRLTYGIRVSGFYSADMSTVASSTTISPISQVILVTGTTPIQTITPQAGCTTSTVVCLLTVLADSSGPYTMVTGGNIFESFTSTINRAQVFMYYPSISMWKQVGGSGSGASGVSSFGAATGAITLGGSGALAQTGQSLDVVTGVVDLLASDQTLSGLKTFTQPAILADYTVSTLPTCSSHARGFASVHDATSPTYHGTLTGGGAVVITVFCDGTAWHS